MEHTSQKHGGQPLIPESVVGATTAERTAQTQDKLVGDIFQDR